MVIRHGSTVKTSTKKFITLGMIALLSGCSSIGPTEIQLDRGRYNDIVRDTNQAQLLKNIVRLAYFEPTSYLNISSVTSSYSLSASVPASTSWSSPPGNSWTTGLSPSLAYSDSPTISYSPADNREFVTAILTPLNFQNLSLFFRAGVNKPSVMLRLLFNRFGDMDNASFATRIGLQSVTNAEVVSYKKFFAFTDALDLAFKQGAIGLDIITYQQNVGAIIHFNPGPPTSGSILVRQMLHLSNDAQDFVLMTPEVGQTVINENDVLRLENSKIKNLFFVRFRSLYGIMTYLSHSVQIPKEDIKSGLVIQTRNEYGGIFNWKPVLDGIMKIYSSDHPPKRTFVRTQVNGHWFYIKNDDENSKITFSLLVRLEFLTKGQNATDQPAPILTIPVR